MKSSDREYLLGTVRFEPKSRQKRGPKCPKKEGQKSHESGYFLPYNDPKSALQSQYHEVLMENARLCLREPLDTDFNEIDVLELILTEIVHLTAEIGGLTVDFMKSRSLFHLFSLFALSPNLLKKTLNRARYSFWQLAFWPFDRIWTRNN